MKKLKIGLVNVDAPNGNLALAKISAYYKSKGNEVSIALPWKKYDIIFSSKIFTWTKDSTLAKDGEVIRGGSGYSLYNELPYYIEHIMPDYELFGWKYSIGFTTRGCTKNCKFCIVREKEGFIRVNSDIEEFYNEKYKYLYLLDNNITAHPHGIRQLEKITKMHVKLDCNQGIDKEYIDRGIAKILAKIKWIRTVRLSLNSSREIPELIRAVKLLRDAGVKRSAYQVYLIVTDDIEDAEKRAIVCRDLNLDPWAQPYRDKNNNEISIVQKRFAKWVNRKALFKTAKTFEEFYKYMYPEQIDDLTSYKDKVNRVAPAQLLLL